jgi:hypothetical protein
MSVFDKLRSAKKKYSSWKQTLFGTDGDRKPLGHVLAGGVDNGRDMADEIIDSFDNKLDPEEQKMVRRAIENEIKKEKRAKARKLAREKFKEKRNKSLENYKMIGGGKGKDKSLDEIGSSLTGGGKKKKKDDFEGLL